MCHARENAECCKGSVELMLFSRARVGREPVLLSQRQTFDDDSDGEDDDSSDNNDRHHRRLHRRRMPAFCARV